MHRAGRSLSVYSALSIALVICIATIASAQTGEDRSWIQKFLDSAGAPVYYFAWPSAKYEGCSLEDYRDKQNGWDLVFTVYGKSEFDKSPLWTEVILEIRDGGLANIRWGKNNAFLAQPGSTVKAVVALLIKLGQYFFRDRPAPISTDGFVFPVPRREDLANLPPPSSMDEFRFGVESTMSSRKYTGTLDEFAQALPGIIRKAVQNSGIRSRDYSKESSYIVNAVRACAITGPKAATDCPRAIGIQNVSDKVGTYEHDQERGLAMSIGPTENWGDGKGVNVAVYFTGLASDRNVRLYSLFEAYGIVRASIGPSVASIDPPPSNDQNATARPRSGPVPGHLITDTYSHTLEIVRENAKNGIPDAYSRLIPLFLAQSSCMPLTGDGADIRSPNWKCEPGPGFRMPGDLVTPPGFWEKTGPASYLQACKTKPGERWWMVELAIVGQDAGKKNLIPCAAILGLAGNRQYVLQTTGGR